MSIIGYDCFLRSIVGWVAIGSSWVLWVVIGYSWVLLVVIGSLGVLWVVFGSSGVLWAVIGSAEALWVVFGSSEYCGLWLVRRECGLWLVPQEYCGLWLVPQEYTLVGCDWFLRSIVGCDWFFFLRYKLCTFVTFPVWCEAIWSVPIVLSIVHLAICLLFLLVLPFRINKGTVPRDFRALIYSIIPSQLASYSPTKRTLQFSQIRKDIRNFRYAALVGTALRLRDVIPTEESSEAC